MSKEPIMSGDIAVIINSYDKNHGRIVSVAAKMTGGPNIGKFKVFLMTPANNDGWGGSEELFYSESDLQVVPEQDKIYIQKKIPDTEVGNGIVVDMNFINKYLDDDQIRHICEQIISNRLIKIVDSILDTQGRYLGKSMLDIVFEKVARMYADTFDSKYADTMVQRFEQIINDDPKKDYDGDYTNSFYRSTQSKLEEFATAYIKDHPDEIRSMIWPQVEKAGSSVSQYALRTAIQKSIDIEGIIERFVTSGMESGSKEGEQ